MNKTINFKIIKRTFLYMSFLLVTLIVTNSCATDDTQTVAEFTELVWQDEFDADGAPDPANWGYDIGTGVNGWGNNELQYYTDHTENISVQK